MAEPICEVEFAFESVILMDSSISYLSSSLIVKGTVVEVASAFTRAVPFAKV